jgi:hypothetical protein
MKVGLVTSYMPPHLGGIERIAETRFIGYTDSGAEVRHGKPIIISHLLRVRW